jgi:hypothetical protein
MFLSWVVVKAAGLLGLSFLDTWLKRLNEREAQTTARTGQFTSALQTALEAEVTARQIASQERVALWGSPSYQLLIWLIVGPPALYSALVFGDSIFGFSFDIDKAPDRFEQLGFGILMTFIGASGAVGAVSSLKGVWRK